HPLQPAVLHHEPDRLMVDQDLDHLLFGVFELPRRRLEVSAGFARHHLDVLAAEAAGRPAAVHRRVAYSDDEDALADLVGVAGRDGLEPVDPDVDAIGLVTAGDLEVFAARGAAADEDGIVTLLEQPLHAADWMIVLYLDISHPEDL